MNKRCVVFSLALSLLLSPVSSWAAGSGDATVNQGVQEFHLPSGQTVYVKEDHDQPIVTIDTWVKTGSVNENKEFNGVSHFLEHLLFKGTQRFKTGEVDRILESKGSEFNAATSDDFTHYYINTASPFFEQALDLHADMMLHATVPQAELDRERKVVQEEINRADDNPQRRMFRVLSQALFGSHGYSLDTLGPRELIGSIPRQQIMDYYQYWYRPAHFNTIITGDISAQKALELVKKHFPSDSFPSSMKSMGSYTAPTVGLVKTPDNMLVQVMEDPNVSQAYFCLAFMGPDIERREDTFALDAAMSILGNGRSSRLYKNMKESLQLVNGIDSGNSTQKFGGMVYTYAELKPENFGKARQELVRELELFKRNGVTAEELEKVKTQAIKDFVFSNESTEGVASSIGYNVSIGKLSDYTDYVANIQKVTPDDVKRALNKYLDFNKAVWVAMVPKGSLDLAVETKATQELLASVTPKPMTNTTTVAVASATERRTLDNGMTLITRPSKTADTVAIQMFYRGGALVEPIPGISPLVSQLLGKDSLSRTAVQVNEELEARGMNVSVSSHEDYLQVSATSVQDDLGELLVVLGDLLTNPRFDEAEIKKEKDFLRQGLQANRDNPSSIALENLTLALYPNHPYGNVGKRIEAHLDLITRDHLVQYYNTYVVPRNLVISAVGNFDPDVLASSLNSLFPATLNQRSSLKGNPLETAEPVGVLPKDKMVEEGKAQQSATWIARGWLAPTSDSRDYTPLKVLNSMLGTGMSSRLFVNLREKQGLAYVVSSFFPSLSDRSRFVMYIGTDPKNRTQVLNGFNKEISRLQSEATPGKELQEAKDKLSGSFALAHETNASQAYYLGLYETIGLGYEFDTMYPRLIQTVTTEDIRKVAKKYFAAPNITSVVAPGVAEKVDPKTEPKPDKQ